jgi:hypothetical protein
MTEKTNKAMPSPASCRKPHPDLETKDGILMTPLRTPPPKKPGDPSEKE